MIGVGVYVERHNSSPRFQALRACDEPLEGGVGTQTGLSPPWSGTCRLYVSGGRRSSMGPEDPVRMTAASTSGSRRRATRVMAGNFPPEAIQRHKELSVEIDGKCRPPSEPLHALHSTPFVGGAHGGAEHHGLRPETSSARENRPGIEKNGRKSVMCEKYDRKCCFWQEERAAKGRPSTGLLASTRLACRTDK